MQLLNKTYFTEPCEEAGMALSFAAEKVHEEKTPYQTIAIYKTTHFGYLMVIDNCTMLTSRDNFLYHEMMAHFPLFTHPDPKNIVIIGGGDCGTLREVLKHDSVKHAHLIDIDERVTRLSEQYFPELCESNQDPRAALSFIDGIEWMKKTALEQPGRIDVIIVDSTDPIGPGEGLFTSEFYQTCYDALTDNGLLIQQSESPLIHRDILQNMRQNMHDAQFQSLHTACFPQPCYPTGWWSATIAVKSATFPNYRQSAILQKTFETQYYNASIHQGALAIPECLTTLCP